jgi:hypothetical protein
MCEPRSPADGHLALCHPHHTTHNTQHQDEDTALSLPGLLLTPRGIATVVFEVLALAAMAPFIVIELGSVQAYSGGWLSLWNLLDVVTYSLQVCVCVCVCVCGCACVRACAWHCGWVAVWRDTGLREDESGLDSSTSAVTPALP